MSPTRVNIRDQIVEQRRDRIRAEGYALGQAVPPVRTARAAPFDRMPLAICEIKRRSPSRGAINAQLDPVDQARIYYEAGIRSVSILTEEDHFGGSLADLMAVKAALPDLAVLRKDFLIDVTDVEWSHRAGADAILLIVSMLEPTLLGAMLRRAEELGMAALVEVHSREEIEAVRALRPKLMGINCRDLETFQLDRLLPLRLRRAIDWDAAVVFESGIFAAEDVRFAQDQGFSGFLVGESVVRQPALVPQLLGELVESSIRPAAIHPNPAAFWGHLSQVLGESRRPLVKICGLTNRDDALLAQEAGADLLGFVFAESPRRANEALVRELADLRLPKIAVVVARPKERGLDQPAELPPEVARLLSEGLIDAVQLHGLETAEECSRLAWPYFKAVRPQTVSDLQEIAAFRSPRVLLDAWSAQKYGGTGTVLPEEIIAAAAKGGALWLSGGIGPDNVAAIVAAHRPELIDVSSRLEAEPGRKDPSLVRQFFKELHRVNAHS